MSYAQRRPDPGRHLTGIGLVVALHVAIVYALVTGLATRIVEVVRLPIETKVIEEVKKKPPPPQVVVPPPELAVPPPPYIPPPEVRIAKPPAPPPIVAITRTPPRAPVVITPSPPPAPAPAPVVAAAAPPAPPPPKPVPAPVPAVTAGVACSNYRTAMGDAAFPREARRRGIEHGDALIQFTLKPDGRVTDVKALHASDSIFARASEEIVEQFKCRGQGREVVVQVPFGYRLE